MPGPHSSQDSPEQIAARLGKLFRMEVTAAQFENQTQVAFHCADNIETDDVRWALEKVLDSRGKLETYFPKGIFDNALYIPVGTIHEYDKKNGEGAFFNALEVTYRSDSDAVADKIEAIKNKRLAEIEKISREALPYHEKINEIFGKTDFVIESDFSFRKPKAVIAISEAEPRLNALDALKNIGTQSGLPMDGYGTYYSVFAEGQNGIDIGIDDIKSAETGKGGTPGLFFEKLAPKKEEIAAVIAAAQKRSAEIMAMPSFQNGGGYILAGADGIGLDDRGERIAIMNGNFALPEHVKSAALDYARQLRADMKAKGLDPIDVRETAGAAGLNGDKGILTDEELASFLVAKSLFNPEFQFSNKIKTGFDGWLPEEAYQGKGQKDPRVTFEMAKQILGDNFGSQVTGGIDTTTPEGDKPYIEATLNSPRSTRLR